MSEAKSESMSYPGGPFEGLAVNTCERSASVGVLGAWFGAYRTPLYKAPYGVQDAGVPRPHPGRLRVYHVSVFTGVVALARIEESRVEGKHTSDDQELSAIVRAVQHGRRVAWRWCELTSGADFPCNHLPDGVGSDGTAGVQKAEVSDLHHTSKNRRRCH